MRIEENGFPHRSSQFCEDKCNDGILEWNVMLRAPNAQFCGQCFPSRALHGGGIEAMSSPNGAARLCRQSALAVSEAEEAGDVQGSHGDEDGTSECRGEAGLKSRREREKKRAVGRHVTRIAY